MYVSERIANIKELEHLIQQALSESSRLQKELHNKTPDIKQALAILDELQYNLEKAHNFEFCIERKGSI